MLARKQYEPPNLEPLTISAVTKHLASEVLVGPDFAGSMDVKSLLREYGSPLFVISEEMLRKLYREFYANFSAPGINTRIAYSYKTNYLPSVCAIMHEEGAWAEVVSGMEYSLARSLGVPGKNIVFNGPYKTPDELALALAEGAVVTLDGFDDLARVEEVAASLPELSRIGIRVNFKHGPMPWTKFGFSYDSGEAVKALERIAKNPKLKLDLLHNHSGTFLIFHDIYAKAAEVLIETAKQARKLGLAPTMVDFGGGFPSSNQLKPFYDVPGGTEFKDDMLAPFGEAILGRLRRENGLFGENPTLVLEPGRALVDAAAVLASTVVAKKFIPDQGTGIVLDAGVNIVPTAYWYDHRVETHGSRDGRQNQNSRESVNIYGPLCMQSDILRERTQTRSFEVGDPVVISNVGAYCHTMSMQFIRTRPATILLGRDGPEVIQRRETWRDVFVRDSLPDRLRRNGIEF